MCGRPSATSTPNQTSVIGPKARPMPPVPKRCTANSTGQHEQRDRHAPQSCSAGLATATSRPSTADSTQIAGVMTPSP